jgi:hypothetical protein
MELLARPAQGYYGRRERSGLIDERVLLSKSELQCALMAKGCLRKRPLLERQKKTLVLTVLE